jgi:hypothetical protein
MSDSDEESISDEVSFVILKQYVTLKGEHEWRISKFWDWLATKAYGESVSGPEFTVSSCVPLQTFRFQLKLFHFDSNVLTIFLKNCGPNRVEINKLILSHYWDRDRRRAKSYWDQERKDFSLGKGMYSKEILVPTACVNRERSALTFKVEIEIMITIEDDQPDTKKCENASALIEDLQNELESPNFSDATLICEEREFLCHRVLLSAR